MKPSRPNSQRPNTKSESSSVHRRIPLPKGDASKFKPILSKRPDAGEKIAPNNGSVYRKPFKMYTPNVVRAKPLTNPGKNQM